MRTLGKGWLLRATGDLTPLICVTLTPSVTSESVSSHLPARHSSPQPVKKILIRLLLLSPLSYFPLHAAKWIAPRLRTKKHFMFWAGRYIHHRKSGQTCGGGQQLFVTPQATPAAGRLGYNIHCNWLRSITSALLIKTKT